MDFNLEIDLKDIMRSVSMSVGSKNIQSGEYYIDITNFLCLMMTDKMCMYFYFDDNNCEDL